MDKLLDLDLKFSSTNAKDNKSNGITAHCYSFNDCMTMDGCKPPEKTRSVQNCTLGGPPYYNCPMNPNAIQKI